MNHHAGYATPILTEHGYFIGFIVFKCGHDAPIEHHAESQEVADDIHRTEQLGASKVDCWMVCDGPREW